jgi:hypothetical protein
LLLASGFTLFWIAFGAHLLPEARRTDFLNLYMGASFALDGDWQHIYTQAGQFARERQFVPERAHLWPFVRPPFYAMVMAPLALMPFRTAFWFWIAAQSAILVGCWAWAWKRFGPEAVVWGALLFVGPLGIAHGQDCALFLALVCGAFALGEKKRMFLCGLILGLGLTKFHLFLLWPLVMLIQKRWRMLAGFAVCGLGQALLSLAIVGWSGLRGYAAFILDMNRHYSPEAFLDIDAILLDAGLSSGPWRIILTALVIVLVCWHSRRIGPLWMTFTVAIAGSLLIGPHVYYYDGTMLLLPLWCVIVLSHFPIARIVAATICTPLTHVASVYGPPLACFMALALLVLLVAVCLGSRLSAAEPELDARLDDRARCVQR